MIVAFYDDSVKTTTLLTSQNFKISDRGQTPDVKGSSDRTIDGTLKSWEIYRRYEEELSIDHLKPAGWTIIKGWIDNSTAIY